MKNQEESTSYEMRILQEIASVETRLRDLLAERQALRRLLAKERSRDKIISGVNRKNSIDRMLIEASILNSLKESKYKSTKELYNIAKSVAPDLNYNTFRSHIHRLKERGLIINQNNRKGYWKI